MKRLLLLRHAKTVPAGPGIEDFDRPLLPRGRENAAAIGRHMRERRYLPTRIVSSPSQRTRETLDMLLEEWHIAPSPEYRDDLYLAEPAVILAVIRSVPEASQTLMVVGHNPGMEIAASLLAREPVKRKEKDRFDLIEEKFPTAALAVLDFDVPRWRDVAPGQGMLADFVRPRDL